MRCDVARERVSALIDGELSSAMSREILDHAETCPACARYRNELQELSGRLAVARETAPRGLMRRIQTRLALEQVAETEPVRPAPLALPALAATLTRWRPSFRHASVLLFACFVSVAATWWLVRTADTHTGLTRDVMAAHIRSLLQENQVQVASASTHTVKPWFAGRLEFTPVVKDLTADGFELVGGRLDYVGGRRVATLVYRKRQHQISVFIWPSAEAEPLRVLTVDGYNLASWTKQGMSYWAASDINQSELRELQSLL